jgi:hypothetical protein
MVPPPRGDALYLQNGPLIGWVHVRGSEAVDVTWLDENAIARGLAFLLMLLRPPPPHLLVHCAALRVGTKALLAVGPSGAGKSTLSSLFTDADLLTDEMAVVDVGTSTVHSSPLQSSSARTRVIGTADLVAIVALEKHPSAELGSLSKLAAIQLLMGQTFTGLKSHALERFEAVNDLVGRVELATLRFAKDRTFVPLLLDLLR